MYRLTKDGRIIKTAAAESTMTAAAAEPEGAEPATELARYWSGFIGFENQLTGDGRLIELNALSWDEGALPFRIVTQDVGAHDGAQIAGRILTIERKAGGKLWAAGDFDLASEAGREASRLVGGEFMRGVSMDLDSIAYEYRIASEVYERIQAEWNEFMGDEPVTESEPETDDEGRVIVHAASPDDEIMVTTSARIRAATLVAIPAFAEALIDASSEAPAGIEASETANEAPALVAAAAPMRPPAAWFADPQLAGPTALTVTDGGRIFGHLALWGTCHTAYQQECVTAPSSPSGYAYFHTGAVETAEGSEVPVGHITMSTGHAAASAGVIKTLAHYENTGTVAADVAAGEDAHGIWVAGAVRPKLTDEQRRELRSAPLSGDWRRVGGRELELVAALSVNVPGFPVPRPKGFVAGGAVVSLVASGVVKPETAPAPFSVSDEDARILLELMNWRRSQTREQAGALSTRVRAVNAEALARRARASLRQEVAK